MTAVTSNSRKRPASPLAFLDTRRLVVAILFVLLFAMAVRIPVDTDTWWHLRAGATTLQSGQILQTDLFSLTRYNQPWINHSWGSQIIMTAFFNLFGGATGNGSAGLAIYTAILAVFGMGCAYLMCEGNAYLRSIILVVAAAAAAVFWSARPQMTSFALSGAILVVLHWYKRRKLDRLWLIPVMMVLWVNLHGGFSIGFILLFGFIAGEILGRLFDKSNPEVLSWPQIGKVILITIVSAVALVINPNTVQMWGYSFKTFGIGVLQQFIQEWASPDFHGRETWPFVALLLGTFAAVGLSGKRIDWTDLALFCGTAFMSLYAGRNISTFALVSAPVLSRHLSALLDRLGLRLSKPRTPRGAVLILNWALLILIVFGAGFKIIATLNPKTVTEVQAEYLPVAAAQYLNTHKPAQPMFNSYNWGGYLLFAAPDYKVFVDGRTDLYDDALLREWLNTLNGINWRATFAKYGIKLVVIERDSPLASFLRVEPDWKEANPDDKTAIFEAR